MNNSSHPVRYSAAERIAAASVVAVVVGLLLPKAALQSLDRALLLWVVTSVLIGLLLGATPSKPLKPALFNALLPSALLPLTFLGFIVVRLIADIAKSGNGYRLVIPMFSGVEVDLLSPPVLLSVLALALIGFFATMLVTVLASTGSRPIAGGLARLNNLGPDGVERVNKMLIAAGGVLTSLTALWVAFGA